MLEKIKCGILKTLKRRGRKNKNAENARQSMMMSKMRKAKKWEDAAGRWSDDDTKSLSLAVEMS